MVTAGRVVGEAEDGSGTDEFPDPVDVCGPHRMSPFTRQP